MIICFAFDQCCHCHVLFFHSYFRHFKCLTLIKILKLLLNRLKPLLSPATKVPCICLTTLLLLLWLVHNPSNGSSIFSFGCVVFVCCFSFAASFFYFFLFFLGMVGTTFVPLSFTWILPCSLCPVLITDIRCRTDCSDNQQSLASNVHLNNDLVFCRPPPGTTFTLV